MVSGTLILCFSDALWKFKKYIYYIFLICFLSSYKWVFLNYDMSHNHLKSLPFTLLHIKRKYWWWHCCWYFESQFMRDSKGNIRKDDLDYFPLFKYFISWSSDKCSQLVSTSGYKLQIKWKLHIYFLIWALDWAPGPVIARSSHTVFLKAILTQISD